MSFPYKAAYRFRQLFGIPINKYWCPLLGFDIVKFDDEIIKSGDEQMKQVIIDEWGQEAADLIESLL